MDEKSRQGFCEVILVTRSRAWFLIWLAMLTSSLCAQEKGEFTDVRDGHVYPTVKIGDQTWMAENLAYLPEVSSVKDLRWDESCYWVYGYNGESVEEAGSTPYYNTCGVLYNWTAAMEDVCPSGWSIPEEADWQEIERFLGMDEEQLGQRGWRASGETGKKLQSFTEFNALLGGLLGYEAFEGRGYVGYFWVGTATHRDNAWVRAVSLSEDGTKRIEERKWFGCSVRCIRTD